MPSKTRSSKTQPERPNTHDAGPMSDWCSVGEKCAREEPWKCTGTAFGVGLLLALLPMGVIVGGLVRLLFALVRPVLLILGVMKIFEEIDRRSEPASDQD